MELKEFLKHCLRDDRSRGLGLETQDSSVASGLEDTGDFLVKNLPKEHRFLDDKEMSKWLSEQEECKNNLTTFCVECRRLPEFLARKTVGATRVNEKLLLFDRKVKKAFYVTRIELEFALTTTKKEEDAAMASINPRLNESLDTAQSKTNKVTLPAEESVNKKPISAADTTGSNDNFSSLYDASSCYEKLSEYKPFVDDTNFWIKA